MKTAKQLNITEAEHLALQGVAAGLASGAYVHRKNYSDLIPSTMSFDMEATCQSDDCGTVACIGGWVAREMGKTVKEADEYVMAIESGPLLPLYYPDHVLCWSNITPAIAAAAIYEFLDGNEVDYPALIDAA